MIDMVVPKWLKSARQSVAQAKNWNDGFGRRPGTRTIVKLMAYIWRLENRLPCGEVNSARLAVGE